MVEVNQLHLLASQNCYALAYTSAAGQPPSSHWGQRWETPPPGHRDTHRHPPSGADEQANSWSVSFPHRPEGLMGGGSDGGPAGSDHHSLKFWQSSAAAAAADATPSSARGGLMREGWTSGCSRRRRAAKRQRTEAETGPWKPQAGLRQGLA